MTPAAPIWIIDDSADIRLCYAFALKTAGYRVAAFAHGGDALEQLPVAPPALVVLDVDMPDMDGWQTLSALRQRGYEQPILMITGVNDEASRVKGLDHGADDYLGKPCGLDELVARVRALLRRASPRAMDNAPLQFGDVRVDLARRVATKAGEPLRLTRTDFALLKLLHENLGAPVSRERINECVWSGQARSSHTLDTHLWRLRKKLGDSADSPRWIRNVPGIGYVLSLDAD